MDDFSGNLRVSDAERDEAVSGLTSAFEAGRLTMEEFDERSTQALRAKTRGDLAGLFTDLPSGAPKAKPVPATTSAPPARGLGGPALVGVAALLLVTVISVATSLQEHHTVVFVAPIILWLLFFRRMARGHHGGLGR
jgi:hypothetical protein